MLLGIAAWKKGAALYESMSQAQSVNIRAMSRNRAEQVGYYRFLENQNVSVSELVRSAAGHCQQQVAGRHVLAISDSSEINLQAQAGDLKFEDIGVVGNNHDVGFFLHPTLVVDAESGFPLGLSAIQLWHRDPKRPDKYERQYPQLPIEEKESYKWLLSAERSRDHLMAGDAVCVTHVGDRESDIYEELVRVPDAHTRLLVRSCRDRRLHDKATMLYETLSQQPVEGTYTVEVLADPRRNRESREAWLAVRFAPATLRCPKKVDAHDYRESVSLYAVEAKEVIPPAGAEPIHWRLLTTHPVHTVEQSLQVIQWYRWRWQIEQLFALLKRVGLDLESTRLESLKAIERLTILALMVTLRLLQLKAGRADETLSASVTFNDQQQQSAAKCSIASSPSITTATPKKSPKAYTTRRRAKVKRQKAKALLPKLNLGRTNRENCFENHSLSIENPINKVLITPLQGSGLVFWGQYLRQQRLKDFPFCIAQVARIGHGQ